MGVGGAEREGAYEFVFGHPRPAAHTTLPLPPHAGNIPHTPTTTSSPTPNHISFHTLTPSPFATIRHTHTRNSRTLLIRTPRTRTCRSSTRSRMLFQVHGDTCQRPLRAPTHTPTHTPLGRRRGMHMAACP